MAKQTKAEKQAAIKKHQDARAALKANGEREMAQGIRHETDAYLRLNSAVIAAERDVPWYRR